MFQAVNVKEAGAKGDGINDDGPLLQALINDVSKGLGAKAVYFPEGRYRVTRPLVVRKNVWLAGQSITASIIDAAVSDGMVFKQGFLNARVENLLVRGGGAQVGKTGIRLSGSQMSSLRGIEVAGFHIGIDLSNGKQIFAGYNHVSNFQVTGCCTGVRALVFAHSNTLRDGRVLGGDVGIEIQDVEALSIHGVTSEGCRLPLSIRGVVQCSVTSCYFEALNALGSSKNPAFDIELDAGNAKRSTLVFTGNLVQTPGRLVVPPTAFLECDSPALPGMIPLRHPAATAGRSFARNGRLRMWRQAPLNIPNWTVSGPVAQNTSDWVTGGRSMLLEGVSSASCGFRVPDPCGWVTAGVRYKWLAPAVTESVHLVADKEKELFMTPPGPLGVWREDFFSIPVAPGAKGAVTISAKGGRVLIDEVWVVAGRAAAASRAYGERVELLDQPPPLVRRQNVVANETWKAGPLTGLRRRPAGAVGALLRLSVLCKGPVRAAHYVMFGTTGGNGSVPAPKCFALFEDTESTQDVTVRLGAGLSGEYHTLDGTPVDYAVWLLGWVLL